MSELLRVHKIRVHPRSFEFRKDFDQGRGFFDHVIRQRRYPQTAENSPENSIYAVDAKRRFAPLGGADVKQPVKVRKLRGRLIAIDDDVMLIEVLGDFGNASPLQIFLGSEDMILNRHQPPLNEVGLSLRRKSDRDVGLSEEEIKLQIVDQEERYRDVGEHDVKLVHPRGQPSRAKSQRCGDFERSPWRLTTFIDAREAYPHSLRHFGDCSI